MTTSTEPLSALERRVIPRKAGAGGVLETNPLEASKNDAIHKIMQTFLDHTEGF